MSDDPVRLRLHVGDGGWALAVTERTPDLETFVQFQQAPDGRLGVANLVARAWTVTGGDRDTLRAKSLRDFPLAAVEAAANTPEYREELLAGLDVPTALVIEPPSGAAPAQTYRAGAFRGELGGGRLPRRAAAPSPDDLPVLGTPASKPYPEDFYVQVAAHYRVALRYSSARPAVWLAERSDVPLRTVHRWVAEARKRHHLPPGRKGKAG